MGYQVVEFYAPYHDWTVEQAKDMRKLMDDLGVVCNSTHNNSPSFTDQGLAKSIELNHILGSRYIVMASAGPVEGLDGWKKVADRLARISEKVRPANLNTGYHNHKPEFVAIDGKRPIEMIAENTPKEVMLQFDVGTCVEAGSDPVAWIKANPGRIRSIHCKDWGAGEGPDRGYRVLFGEGDSPWKRIFEAAESVGGVEYYLIEQEGSRFPSLETAQRCLETWKKMRA
jgi:sugar phosphate isomerase/epimerase